MENMNWNYPTSIWFGLNRVKEIQNACDHFFSTDSNAGKIAVYQ